MEITAYAVGWPRYITCFPVNISLLAEAGILEEKMSRLLNMRCNELRNLIYTGMAPGNWFDTTSPSIFTAKPLFEILYYIYIYILDVSMNVFWSQ